MLLLAYAPTAAPEEKGIRGADTTASWSAKPTALPKLTLGTLLRKALTAGNIKNNTALALEASTGRFYECPHSHHKMAVNVRQNIKNRRTLLFRTTERVLSYE